MEDKIREIIGTHARLTVSANSLPEEADLYAAGMSSQASVSLMIALEDEFDVEFPDRMLKRSVFQSIAAIRTALGEIQGTTAA
ncbi:MAG TPA: acyl carrier protein [Solirubrobacteraceae bacterium]|jgi:acyl carrier protein|nr:acyl carrier protein [Solirubrobacteraceae bacterium]